MPSLAGDWADEAWKDWPLQEGTYRVRKDKVWHPVRVWFGPPADEITGLPLDRSWRWQALMSGEPVEISEVWPWALRTPITEEQYEEMLSDV